MIKFLIIIDFLIGKKDELTDLPGRNVKELSYSRMFLIQSSLMLVDTCMSVSAVNYVINFL